MNKLLWPMHIMALHEKVQVGNDQEKAQSERDPHSKNQGGKKLNQQSGNNEVCHRHSGFKVDDFLFVLCLGV